MMTDGAKYYYEDYGRELRPGALAIRPDLVSRARSAVASRPAISRDSTFTLMVEPVQVPFEGYVALPDPRQIEPVE
jgi:hypothetical protein